jgi:hypothetical protein
MKLDCIGGISVIVVAIREQEEEKKKKKTVHQRGEENKK